jgi:hypothetical protein
VRRVRPAAAGAALGLAGLLLALGGCMTPPVMLETERGELVAASFPPGSEIVSLEVEPGTRLRGVFVPAQCPEGAPSPAPVVLGFLESSGTLLRGARSSGLKAHASTLESDEPLLDDGREQGLPLEAARPLLQLEYRWLTRVSQLGFSALAFDYTGIGGSDGERSPEHLRRDAHAAWEEALRRAGGDPSRVVLRGVSIGALAVAALLQDGAQPRAVMLVAPVRAETVAANGARAMHGPWLGLLASAAMGPALDVSLTEQLREHRGPTLLVTAARDEFLRHDERAELRDAVTQAGGLCAVRYDDHIDLSLAARDLLVLESWFLGRLPGLGDPDQRLRAEREAWHDLCRGSGDDAPFLDLQPGEPAGMRLEALLSELPLACPGPAGALALAGASTADAIELLDLLAWLPAARRERLDPLALRWLFDLDDPGGRITSSELFELRALVEDGVAGRSADAIASLLDDSCEEPLDPAQPFLIALQAALGGAFKVERGPAARLMADHSQTLQERGVSRADAHRRILRVALRCAGIPDRVTTGADGTATLEVLERGGCWRALPVP